VIVGNEALGIDKEILAQADGIVSIPLYGWKNSLNVSSAFAIACHILSGAGKA
jgi:tRNA G18 (ribose-2'-O)-methylase SpoU